MGMPEFGLTDGTGNLVEDLKAVSMSCLSYYHKPGGPIIYSWVIDDHHGEIKSEPSVIWNPS